MGGRLGPWKPGLWWGYLVFELKSSSPNGLADPLGVEILEI